MSMASPIATSLDSLSVRIATINEPSQKDPARFVIIQSELEALGKEIGANESNLPYLERFTAIQDEFRIAQEVAQKHSADSRGMGSRSVSYTPSSQRFGSSRSAPVYQQAPGRPLPPGVQRTMGSINQYTDRSPEAPIFSSYNRNTCPCTSLAFASRFLNYGTTGLDGNMVDNVIRIGQDTYLERMAHRREALRTVAIPVELQDSVRGTMMAPADALGAFESFVGERPRSPDAFFLVDLGPKIEGTLSGALNKSIIPDAQRNGGRTIVPLKLKGQTFFALIDVTGREIKSSLCTAEGQPLPGTESRFPKSGRGVAMTSKALVGLMTTECRKAQLAAFIQKELVPLAQFHPSGRVASTITINGQITAIGIDASGPTVKVTLFDSHGNRPLTGSGNGFVYQADGVNDAADVLLRMMLVRDTEIDVRGAVTESQMKMIRGSVGSVNEVGSCVLLPREELVPFGAVPVVRGPDARDVGSSAAYDPDRLEQLEEKEHKDSRDRGSSPLVSREEASPLLSAVGQQSPVLDSAPTQMEKRPASAPTLPVSSEVERTPPRLTSELQAERSSTLVSPQPQRPASTPPRRPSTSLVQEERSAPLTSPEPTAPVQQDPRLERMLAAGLKKSILPQARAQLDGRIIIPITTKTGIHHVLFEVTREAIKSSLCSQAGVPVAQTQSTFANDDEGIRMTSKALVGFMLTASQKL